MQAAWSGFQQLPGRFGCVEHPLKISSAAAGCAVVVERLSPKKTLAAAATAAGVDVSVAVCSVSCADADCTYPPNLHPCICSPLSVLQRIEQVLASVFGPREVDSRADMQQDKAIIKCEYAMAAFSTGVCCVCICCSQGLCCGGTLFNMFCACITSCSRPQSSQTACLPVLVPSAVVPRWHRHMPHTTHLMCYPNVNNTHACCCC